MTIKDQETELPIDKTIIFKLPSPGYINSGNEPTTCKFAFIFKTNILSGN